MSCRTLLGAVGAAAVLTACVAPLPYDQRVPKTATYQKVDAQWHDELASGAARIEQMPHLVRLTLADALFAADSAQPSDAGKAMLIKLGPALKELRDQRVVVASFTDSVSVGVEPPRRFPSTVPLTQARAAAVAGILREQGVPAEIVFISGLGDSHPVASDDTTEGRARNRRIEIDIVEAPA